MENTHCLRRYFQDVLGLKSVLLGEISIPVKEAPASSESVQAPAVELEEPAETRMAFVLDACSEGHTELIDNMLRAMGFSRNTATVVDLSQEGVSPDVEVVVCFGEKALKRYLPRAPRFDTITGRWQNLENVSIMPTLSLIEIDNNKARKRLVWQHLQMVMEALGVQKLN